MDEDDTYVGSKAWDAERTRIENRQVAAISAARLLGQSKVDPVSHFERTADRVLAWIEKPETIAEPVSPVRETVARPNLVRVHNLPGMDENYVSIALGAPLFPIVREVSPTTATEELVLTYQGQRYRLTHRDTDEQGIERYSAHLIRPTPKD